MEELSPEELVVKQKEYINHEIKELLAAKKFPDTVKRLMATPEWKEVIEEAYINNFAKDLVRSYDEFDDQQKKDFDEEYKVRSRFLNCIQAWAEGADKADEQIARYNQMLEEVSAPQEIKEPTISVS